jgi:hypothetical protein
LLPKPVAYPNLRPLASHSPAKPQRGCGRKAVAGSSLPGTLCHFRRSAACYICHFDRSAAERRNLVTAVVCLPLAARFLHFGLWPPVEMTTGTLSEMTGYATTVFRPNPPPRPPARLGGPTPDQLTTRHEHDWERRVSKETESAVRT